MGGFGSGMGYRITPGRNRTRPYAHELRVLTIKHIKISSRTDSKALFQTQVNLDKFGIKLIEHHSPTNGLWFTFSCPHCKKGRFALYELSIGFRCRTCLNLAYTSENQGKTSRASSMKWKIIGKLSNEADEYPPRPKGMHQKTYEQIINRSQKYDKLGWERFFGFPIDNPYPLLEILSRR